VRCWITPPGLELLAGLEDAMQNGARRFMAPLAASELAAFVSVLDTLRGGMA
jgi:hypothetical protein